MITLLELCLCLCKSTKHVEQLTKIQPNALKGSEHSKALKLTILETINFTQNKHIPM
jgi:hypothetical protein